ncbi:MAG TPA: exodeoxyribonuclease VII large subunit [Elusimicrobia bacterium]|nr:exodeoxyribonuclease VII large subunit [Elusimicrobiota bacterium]
MNTATKPLTVTELSRSIHDLLESQLPDVWVVGEVSQPKTYGSGHTYFTLKDAESQLSCVLFKGAASGLRFKLEHGLEVVARGRVSHYAGSGRTQLIASFLQPKAMGALQLAFEQLKAKLAADGLFDPSRKKPLPLFPERIGIVTSPQGAAIRDMLSILERRFAGLHIRLMPVAVQGEGAKEQIAQAVRDFNEHFPDTDVLLVGRGGGSLEDLWAFNEEVVARAIAASKIPIVSCVGHETDFTIADFVADLRAPTPSAAAELVVPEKAAVLERLRELGRRLPLGLRGLVREREERLRALRASPLLREPRRLYEERAQRVDGLAGRLPSGLRQLVLRLSERLTRTGPPRLKTSLTSRLSHAEKDLLRQKERLQALSPLAVLSRGYAIALKGGRALRKASEVSAGERIRVKVHEGEFDAEVKP